MNLTWELIPVKNDILFMPIAIQPHHETDTSNETRAYNETIEQLTYNNQGKHQTDSKISIDEDDTIISI